MRLSQNFSLGDLVYSETAEQCGIDNTPPPEIVENLKRLAAGLEAVRSLLGAPLEISSGYRCAALNEAVGGRSPSSRGSNKRGNLPAKREYWSASDSG